jgi:aldehyde:ferredoxin oxidoreductase
VEKHGDHTVATFQAADLIQLHGINAFEMEAGLLWLKTLNKKGILGPGKQIHSTLPFDKLGETEFVVALIDQIKNKVEIGKDLSQGFARAAKKWGRLEEDLRTGILSLQYWGQAQHYDARTEAEWGYGSILGDRDCNDHDFNWVVYWTPTKNILKGHEPPVTAQQLAEIIAEKCRPYSDPFMANYSDEAIYSESMVKLVAWHRHYSRYYKQGLGFCDWAWADFVNPAAAGKKGLTGEGEPRFFNAVTGQNISFEDGIKIGRRIWNLDRAIWVLQGRHRDQEVLAEYSYQVPNGPGFTTYELPYYMPVCEDGKWAYKNVSGR